MKNIPSLYKNASLSTLVFLHLRWWLTPYRKIASYLPSKGHVLDMGCGHGLLSAAIALQSPACKVTGIDHDEARVALASEAMKDIPNLHIIKGSVTEKPADSGSYAGITLIDVLHYFDKPIQQAILENSFHALEKGGTMLMRQVNSNRGFMSKWNELYETVSVRIGFSRSEKMDLHFRPRDEWENLIRAIGFEVRSERCGSRLFDETLYICKRPG